MNEELVGQLREKRERLAKYNRQIAENDVARRKLRLEVAATIRTRTNPLTGKQYSAADAEDGARNSADYLDVEQKGTVMQYERDLVWAECEALMLEVQSRIAGVWA